MAHEVEIRSFITKSHYNQLKSYFAQAGKLLSSDTQETIYYDANVDLRIQQAKTYSKIWLKKGQIHDESREEIEIICNKKDFLLLQILFQSLGYRPKVAWHRRRHTYSWRGVTVSIDNTKGYGFIIELEKIVNEKEQEQALVELKQKMTELKIPLTPREEFDTRYQAYITDWKQKNRSTVTEQLTNTALK